MEEAKRLAQKSPLPPIVPVELPGTTAATTLPVLHDIVDTDDDAKAPEMRTPSYKTPEPIRKGIGSQPFESTLQVLN
ncbi:transient-receptor-potential-like protein [Lasius niger]|uniref:Transient-receptor-potential-like protein n=1 Tax=Lasius niger TaxID=67767 RepID=A0A0J7KPT0_LASNI|nr:transient-receptor-potential-like protein [Lasius niger]